MMKKIFSTFIKNIWRIGDIKQFSFDNPIDALNHIDKNISNCSLVITDYKIPQMNGIDFLKKIRKKILIVK